MRHEQIQKAVSHNSTWAFKGQGGLNHAPTMDWAQALRPFHLRQGYGGQEGAERMVASMAIRQARSIGNRSLILETIPYKGDGFKN